MKIKWTIVPISLLAMSSATSAILQLQKNKNEKTNDQKTSIFIENYQKFLDYISQEIEEVSGFNQQFELVNQKIQKLFNRITQENQLYYNQYKQIIDDESISIDSKSSISQELQKKHVNLNDLLTNLERHVSKLDSLDEYEKEEISQIIINKSGELINFRKEFNKFWKDARESLLLEEKIAKISKEYKTKHHETYPQWKVGEKVSNEDLGIEILKISNKKVKLEYIINKVDNSTGTVYIDVLCHLNKLEKQFQIVVKGFSLVNIDEIKTKMNNLLFENFSKDIVTKNPHQKIKTWVINEKTTSQQLGIKILNNSQLDMNVKYLLKKIDSFKGEVEVEAIVEYIKNDLIITSKPKKFKVIGFDNEWDSYKRIREYINSLNNTNFSVEKKLSSKNCWQDFINLLEKSFEKKSNIDKDLLKNIKWTIKDSNINDLVKNWLQDINAKRISQQFVVNIHEKMEPVELNITFEDLLQPVNIELNEKINLKSQFGLWKQEKKVEYVLKNNFDWAMMKNNYGNIVFKNLSLSYEVWPFNKKVKESFKKINLDKLAEGEKIELLKLNLIDNEWLYLPMYTNLFFDLKINNQNQLILTLTLLIDPISRIPSVEAIANIGAIEII